jgi:small GTP-binding protein
MVLIFSWIADAFHPNSYLPVIEASYHIKQVEVTGVWLAKVQIWDTAGMERWDRLTPIYCRDSDLIVLTSAIDLAESGEVIPRLMTFIAESSSVVPPIFLAVNKMDAAEDLVTSVGEIQERYERAFDTLFFVSTKTGENVREMFQHIAHKAVEFAATRKESRAVPLSHTGAGHAIHTASWIGLCQDLCTLSEATRRAESTNGTVPLPEKGHFSFVATNWLREPQISEGK